MLTMTSGKSVRLFLADGLPGGLITAEIMNWTGHVVSAPRSRLDEFLKRPEAQRTGIYVLLGDDPSSTEGTRAYIGEGDNVGERLYMHAKSELTGGKDFWSRAVSVTNKDANLTKAHARYLESRFISIAMEAGRATLVNKTAPPRSPLPESDVSDMEYFIDQAQIILPVLGVNIFRASGVIASSQTSHESNSAEGVSPVFIIDVDKKGHLARAREVDGEFVVEEGSFARGKWSGTDSSYKALRIQLEDNGTLQHSPIEGLRQFSKATAFKSSSAAAAVVYGRSANGRTSWIAETTKLSFGAWQESRLVSPDPSSLTTTA